MNYLFRVKQRSVKINKNLNMKINKNNIIGLCLIIVDKQMQDILDAVIKIVNIRPKNKYIVNRKLSYKEYICNQYES